MTRDIRIQTACSTDFHNDLNIGQKAKEGSHKSWGSGGAEAEGSRGDTVAGVGGNRLEVVTVCSLLQTFVLYFFFTMGNSHGKLSIRRQNGRRGLQRPSFFSGRCDADKADDKADTSKVRRGKREKSAVAVSSSGVEGTATLDELSGGETAAGHDGDSEDISTNTKPPAQDASTADAPDVDPDLTAVIPYALPMLPSKQAVRYFTTCRAWGAAGDEVLPTLLRRELRSVLPPRLVWMLNRSEKSREHWTEFARQWFRKGFVRAKVGRAEDGSLDVDSKDMNSSVSYCASLVLLLHHAVYLLYICVDL